MKSKAGLVEIRSVSSRAEVRRFVNLAISSVEVAIGVRSSSLLSPSTVSPRFCRDASPNNIGPE